MIQGLKASHVALAIAGVGIVGAGVHALAANGGDKPEPNPNASTWKGSEGSFKDVTRLNGTRDASEGAWSITSRGYEDVKMQGTDTPDGFRAAVDGSRSVQRTITATVDESGAYSGKVTTMQREFDDSGSKIETTLTKALFETTAREDGSWSGTVQLADSDERIQISGSSTGNAWKVDVDRPESPYIPHRDFTGTGPITIAEQLAIAVADAT